MLMGEAAYFQGHMEDSQGYFAEAQQLCRETGDRRLMVYINLGLGSNAVRLGDYPDARQHLEEAAAISQDFNDLISQAYSGRELARLELLQGDYLRAERLLQESAAFFNEFGSAWEAMEHAPETASVLRHLGKVCLAQDDARQAEDANYLARALQLAARHRLAPVAMDAFTGAALLLARFGEKEQAVELLALAEGHLSSTYETKEQAARELAVLATGLPARVLRAAKGRGRSRDWRLAAEETGALIEKLVSNTPGRQVTPVTPQ